MVSRGATKFKMGVQTIHLAMTYFDIVVHGNPEAADKPWQLHAITCLVLACKFQERDDNVPLISEVIKYLVSQTTMNGNQLQRVFTVRGVNYETVTKHEVTVLRAVGWDLHKVTVYSFVENYNLQGLVNS